MALIELHDVSKTYHRDKIEIPVLDGVTIAVPEGDFLGLMGPSGSGKSTLLNLLAGIDRPTRGAIRIGGTEISSLPERTLAAWRSRHIGFIFQLYNLIPVLTAFENVELPLLLTNLTRKERRDHVMTALGIVGLTDREKHYPRQLSGGQEQRVAIARATVTDPTALLGAEASSSTRIITIRSTSMIFNMPTSHAEAIRAMSGVRDLAWANWFGGIYKDSSNFFANIAIDPESYLRLYPEIQLGDPERAAF